MTDAVKDAAVSAAGAGKGGGEMLGCCWSVERIVMVVVVVVVVVVVTKRFV